MIFVLEALEAVKRVLTSTHANALNQMPHSSGSLNRISAPDGSLSDSNRHLPESSTVKEHYKHSQSHGNFINGSSGSSDRMGIKDNSGKLGEEMTYQKSTEERGKPLTPPSEISISAVNNPKRPSNTGLQVVKTGALSMDEIKTYYLRLVRHYLSSFNQGIYRTMFFDVLRRRTYSLTPPGANKGVQSMMIQVIDNRVYLLDPYDVPKNAKPFYRSRINEMIWLLSRLSRAGRIQNTEFMVSIHDCVQTIDKPHSYRGATYQESIPAFTIVSCNFSNNIPFPMWEGDVSRGGGFSKWDRHMQEYATLSSREWEAKKDLAVFRGGNRPSMYFRNKSDANLHCDHVGRTRLVQLSREHPTDLDASVGGSCGGFQYILQRMDEGEQQNYKYVVYAEGNCFWADRLNKQVFGSSLILKQETPCGQFWEPLLSPMVHYIPTDFFFDDLIGKISWARENDDKAREIVRNANAFASSFLNLKGIETYVEVLLREYTALLVDPNVKLEAGAVDVTVESV